MTTRTLRRDDDVVRRSLSASAAGIRIASEYKPKPAPTLNNGVTINASQLSAVKTLANSSLVTLLHHSPTKKESNSIVEKERYLDKDLERLKRAVELGLPDNERVTTKLTHKLRNPPLDTIRHLQKFEERAIALTELEAQLAIKQQRKRDAAEEDMAEARHMQEKYAELVEDDRKRAQERSLAKERYRVALEWQLQQRSEQAVVVEEAEELEALQLLRTAQIQAQRAAEVEAKKKAAALKAAKETQAVNVARVKMAEQRRLRDLEEDLRIARYAAEKEAALAELNRQKKTREGQKSAAVEAAAERLIQERMLAEAEERTRARNAAIQELVKKREDAEALRQRKAAKEAYTAALTAQIQRRAADKARKEAEEAERDAALATSLIAKFHVTPPDTAAKAAEQQAYRDGFERSAVAARLAAKEAQYAKLQERLEQMAESKADAIVKDGLREGTLRRLESRKAQQSLLETVKTIKL